MKNRNIQFKPASIAKTRWVSYAAAGAATALAGSQSAEAAIHYSGPVNEEFLKGHADSFKLDQPGDFFRLSQYSDLYGYYGYGHHHHGHHGHHGGELIDRFAIFGIASAAFRGVQGHLSKLSPGQTISMGNFIEGGGNLAGANRGQGRHSSGFIGFRFDNGAGVQYGWARIKMQGGKNFILVDYAYADPGEPLGAGQTSEGTLSDEQAPDEGSLGGLALGAVGLLAWRKSRKSLTAR